MCWDRGWRSAQVLAEESDWSESCSSLRKVPLSLAPCDHILMPR